MNLAPQPFPSFLSCKRQKGAGQGPQAHNSSEKGAARERGGFISPPQPKTVHILVICLLFWGLKNNHKDLIAVAFGVQIGLGICRKVLLFVFVYGAKTRFSGHLYSLLMWDVTHL
jgi:hypothetical protein